MDYSIVIGLEVHVQLLTESKLFCGCSTKFGAPPNSQTCPVCIGMPGVLPVMNRRAFELALKTAVALNCDISDFTKWDRKNYYYPDLPKNYQISQYDLPFSHDGFIDIPIDRNGDSSKRVGIIRAHLEEDAGKLLHSEAGPGDSRVDLNRAGTPLLEIVSQPVMASPAEAGTYLEELRLLLRYLEVSDCNMQEGSLRCDANVNIHVPYHGEFIATPLVEVKNMNSFRGVERAMTYETQRQYEEYKANFGTRWQLIPNSATSFLGRTVLQIGEERDGRLVKVPKATAGWDDPRGVTVVQRRKEEASDYRYFPEPDLVPVVVDDNWVQTVRDSLGELPADRRNRLKLQYSISDYDAGVIIEQGRSFADYFEETARVSNSAKMAANWCQQEVLRTLNDRKIGIEHFPVTAPELGSLIAKVVAGQINNHSAREVFAEMLATGNPADAIIQAKGMQQISNQDELLRMVIQVLDANPKILDDYKKGKKRDQVEGFARGQVMKLTKGQANSNLVQQLVADELARRAVE